MLKRAFALMLAAAALTGCGGGHGTSEKLVLFRPGATWTYSISGGSVSLSGTQGSALPLKADSTVTMTVLSTTATAPNADVVNILDRKLTLNLLDGRVITAISRLYFKQLQEGVFVYGFNNSMGDTITAANDHFVATTATPPNRFLYLPDPFVTNTSLTYSNPFALSTSGDHSYSLQTGTAITALTVPAGRFLVRAFKTTENFGGFVQTGDFDAGNGIIASNLSATLADGTSFSGTLELTSLHL